MGFIDEVRGKRQKLADVLADKDYSGIRKIVEELYPDKAHFIYELLQNAEDAGAKEAAFALHDKMLCFEHIGGEPFNERDVEGITNIGKGAKEDREDKIGRFGVGFKSVFAYTETPHIWSPTFSFKISDLVLPYEINKKSELGKKTRFEFPFNNSKKQAVDAYEEIRNGLETLAETTLLFLSNINTISWRIGDTLHGSVKLIEHGENHIEIFKQEGNRNVSSSHFLRFSEIVENLNAKQPQKVSVAFELGLLPGVSAFDHRNPLSDQMKIESARPGHVAVFFPADKETSGLRFHLHAPFVPELSRASIKDTSANEPLFRQLASLAAYSLHKIRDLNLLTGNFLAVLPNPNDELPERYKVIRSSIIAEMNEKPLTPTYAESHAPAKHLLRAKKMLKLLLSDDDIKTLMPREIPPRWAIAAEQNNSDTDKFLSGLDISAWDIEHFAGFLIERANEDADFQGWLSKKNMEWHQQLYSLLLVHLSKDSGASHKMKLLKIVRLENGAYSLGVNCYFPDENMERDELMPRVARDAYTSGKDPSQQDNSRKFLADIGVREVKDYERIESLLKRRYVDENSHVNEKDYLDDLIKFMDFLKKYPKHAGSVDHLDKKTLNPGLFDNYFIFKSKSGKMRKPGGVFLDSPYIDTGLHFYYEMRGNEADRIALSDEMKHSGIEGKEFLDFSRQVGVLERLIIKRTSCCGNPAFKDIRTYEGLMSPHHKDEDYNIDGLDKMLKSKDREISRLLWKTMCEISIKEPDCLTARFRSKYVDKIHEYPSQIICTLMEEPWVPQAGDSFVRPSQAASDLLPEGFPFDQGYKWLKDIKFGEALIKNPQEQLWEESFIKELGFDNKDVLDRCKRFARLSDEKQILSLAEYETQPMELLDNESPVSKLRADRVKKQAADAPEKLSVDKIRAVQVNHEKVKKETERYLRQLYTSHDNQMICQICKNKELPFKLDDGTYYFEKVELLSELKNLHYQNYIALCPNHAAMFMHANGSKKIMKDNFSNMEKDEMKIVLAQINVTIRFHPKHILDLRMVIEADNESGNGDENA